MKYKILCLIFTCLSHVLMLAQRENDTINTEKLIIIKQYSPTLNDAFKVRSKPSVSDSIKAPQKTVEYTIFSVPVASTFTPAKGAASNIKQNSRPYYYQNYARMGAGNFTNILGEFYGNVAINRYQDLQIDFDHFSSAGGIKTEVLDNNFTDTALNLNFESSERNFIWHAGVNLDYKLYHWYGVDEQFIDTDNQIFGVDIASIDTQQTFVGIGLNGGIDFNEKVIKSVDLYVKNFSDAYDSSENEVGIDSNFEFYLFDHTLDLEANFNFLSGNFDQQFNLSDNGLKYGFLTLTMQPSMQFEIDRLTLDVGLKGVLLNDTQAKESDVFVYPKINSTYKFTDEFILYAGLSGDLNANSYENVVAQNSFVSPTLIIQPTDNAYTAYAGVNGKVSAFSYNLKAFYQQENNYAFFIENPVFGGTFPIPFEPQNNFEYGNSFGLIYDDLRTLGISAEGNYEAFDGFNVGLSAQYFNFALDELPVASYLPDFKLSLNTNYQFGEKWYVHSTLFYVGARDSLQFNTDFSDDSQFSSESVDGFADLNIGVDYQLNERIGLFITGNNIFNNNYQQWRNFDVQGLQVMGGLSYQFDW